MRVDRLLSMLLIISGKGTATGKELAEHFEVSLRTIYRDIEKISEAGIPIASSSGKGGGYYIMDSYNISGLFLNRDEAHTFVAVMKNLHGLFGRNEAFNDIMLKVEHTYKREPEKHKLTLDMSHFSMEQEIKEYMGIISKAITDNRLLVFDYINRDMEYLERTVEPSWIDFRHGHWYVIGFCRVREDYRRFKLVRIKQLRQGPPFAKRELPEDQVAEVIKQSYSQRDIQVVLRFTPRIGAQLPEYFEKEKISRREDGFYLVRDTYPYEEGLLKFILSFGKECELLEPRELRAELQQYMQNMLLSYND
ncbi:YafY family protein [Paenibacillus sp. FSL H8-0259]|uniref:helix-turn-helix transcriptional regulator n=1 Tax=Paenibacillus sp. FSL H8-0259 TaxID=1920423 RepID=UPI00096D386C|nr:YafY family protein [Paenibacillus sp. FSL H8-0259]OMF28940.1 transcriptional regulator [Paenibacillus sp. FSL H8-0259]